MRFMIIVRANEATEAGMTPPKKLLAEMTGYLEELKKAGVFLDANGLQPSSKGWRIKYSGDQNRVLDGPFTESKELIAGYTIIQVKSREEALEWVRRFPNPSMDGGEAVVEVRPLFELEDPSHSDAVQILRDLGAATHK